MPGKSIKEKEKSTQNNLRMNVYNSEVKIVAKKNLPRQIFGLEVSPDLITQAVRIYLANQRAGTHKVKKRSQVSGSTRKIYRQKGTGRARHGDKKAPIFIGGGVAHGPQVRNYRLNMSSKMKKLALWGALSGKLKSQSIIILKSPREFTPKTKNFINILNNLKLTDKKKNLTKNTLFLTDKVRKDIFMAARNVPNMEISPINLINTYQILKNHHLIIFDTAVDLLENKLSKKSVKE